MAEMIASLEYCEAELQQSVDSICLRNSNQTSRAVCREAVAIPSIERVMRTADALREATSV